MINELRPTSTRIRAAFAAAAVLATVLVIGSIEALRGTTAPSHS